MTDAGSLDVLPPTEPAPPTAAARPRRRWLTAIIVVAASLAGLAIAAGATYAIIASQRTPDAAATVFLQALVDGDADAARSQLTTIPTGNRTLLGDQAYGAAEDRVTTFEVVSSENSDGRAVVTAEVSQAGQSSTVELELAIVRRDLGLFDVWRVSPSTLGEIYVSFPRPDDMSLAVNGVDMGVIIGSFDYDVPAFPGTYTFEPTGATDYYDAEPVTVTVGFAEEQAVPAALEVLLTEAGEASARSAVDAQLDACVAQPVLAPQPQDQCGFYVEQDDATYTNIRWTITSRPTVTFGAFTRGGWAVISATPGSLRMDADYTAPGEFGTAEATLSDLTQEGVITGFDEAGAATFESVRYE